MVCCANRHHTKIVVPGSSTPCETHQRAAGSLRTPYVHFVALLILALLFYGNTAAAAAPSLARVIDQAQTKIVKIYGAGGFRGMEGYQSGFLISAEGHVLTALSYVLDTDRITVTLNDGRHYDAKLLGGDPRLEVAVLKIEAANLPHFDLAKAVPLTAGTRILALSNLFNVAMGDEPASVQSGTVRCSRAWKAGAAFSRRPITARSTCSTWPPIIPAPRAAPW